MELTDIINILTFALLTLQTLHEYWPNIKQFYCKVFCCTISIENEEEKVIHHMESTLDLMKKSRSHSTSIIDAKS